ncbi:MAG TPA: AMP-binding protein [Streptosporangiaceae bacterium]|nr:AMP-binding protein [Streptosporangiaceae bacterium]
MSGSEEWSRAGWRAHLPGISDVPAFVDRLGEATIAELAAASADRVPERVALTIDGEPITHAELDTDAARVAGWLARRLQPGDRVLLAVGPGSGFLRCYLGSLRAGAVVVLANPGCTAPELAHLVSDSGAGIAFADHGPARLLAGLPEPPLTVDASELPPGPPGRAGRHVRARPDDTALLAYTSGTTGRPKGVPLTHRQLVTSIRAAMAAWRWSADDVLVHALPLYHQHGLGGVHATLIAGGTGHVRSKFTPAGIIETVQATHASVLLGVPTMYRALLNAAGETDGAPAAAARRGGTRPAASGAASIPLPDPGGPHGKPMLTGLRLAVCGSAPLSPALARRLPAVTGRLPVVRYGTTETGLNISNTCDEPHSGTIGVPLPGVMARIWSEGGELAAGQDGEIQLRGPQVFGGYWHDPAATAAAFTQDGWFRTGDIGRVEPAGGQLAIRGRIKEMIITGGLNVYPHEVETVLESHPSVAEAAVAGVPHEHWGEQVTAWVVMRPGCQLDEPGLIAHARAALAAYKCPKQVFELAALPRNHAGKVVRGALSRG